MKPMLAVNIATNKVRFPVFASPKLDGVRGLVIDGVLRTRSLKTIPNRHVAALFSRPEFNGLDGELIANEPTAKDAYRATQSATSNESGQPNVKFYVFDNFLANGGFAARLETLKRVNSATVIVLEQRLVRNEAELLAFEHAMLNEGYEGLILRDPNGAYKNGRSTANEQGMLKVKRFTDSEALILDVVEEVANTNVAKVNALGHTERSGHTAGMVAKGRMGALHVRDVASGVEFHIGTGFDAEDRSRFWKCRSAIAGKIVKYKSFLIGVKDAPRFPVFLGLREGWDM